MEFLPWLLLFSLWKRKFIKTAIFFFLRITMQPHFTRDSCRSPGHEASFWCKICVPPGYIPLWNFGFMDDAHTSSFGTSLFIMWWTLTPSCPALLWNDPPKETSLAWHNNVPIIAEGITEPDSESVFNKYLLCYYMKEGREEGKKEENKEGRCNLHLEWPPLVWLNCVCFCSQDWHLVYNEFFCCMFGIPVFLPGLADTSKVANEESVWALAFLSFWS